MSERTPEFRCSDGARARRDRSVGTAPPARNWFLVEQSGCWEANAWIGLDVDADIKDRLEELIEDAGARLMLIRRPGRSSETREDAMADARLRGGRRWCVIREQPGKDADGRVRRPDMIWGRAADGHALLDAARLFADPDSVVARIDAPAGPGSGPRIVLVCTHGRKDVCCAVRGRPVAAKAAHLWPEATWECTHTGGDRFAANVILLPDGACYGGLDPDTIEEVVTSHVEGRVDPRHLRGPTGHANQVQAAIVEAFTRYAPLRFDDVAVVSRSGRPDQWGVRLKVRGVGTVEVTGHMETTDPALLSCKANEPKVMHLPMVDSCVVLDSSTREETSATR